MVADVLGASAEEAAKLLDQATGEEDAEDGGRGNALTEPRAVPFLFIRSANFLKRNSFVIPAKRSASRDRKRCERGAFGVVYLGTADLSIANELESISL